MLESCGVMTKRIVHMMAVAGLVVMDEIIIDCFSNLHSTRTTDLCPDFIKNSAMSDVAIGAIGGSILTVSAPAIAYFFWSTVKPYSMHVSDFIPLPGADLNLHNF